MALQAHCDDLRLLLAVSRRGSFLLVGQLLGLAVSSVSWPVQERGFEAASRLTSLHPRCSVELPVTADFHKSSTVWRILPQAQCVWAMPSLMQGI